MRIVSYRGDKLISVIENRNKVLVFAHDAGLYGASQSLFTLLTELNKFDFLVLLPYPGKFESLLKSSGINYLIVEFPIIAFRNVKRLTVKQKIKAVLKYYKQKNRSAAQLNEIVQSFKPQIIYTNTSVVTAGYSLARKYSISHVWHIREFGEPDYQLTYFPSLRKIKQFIIRSASCIFISEAVARFWFKNRPKNAIVVPNGIVSDDLVRRNIHPRQLPEHIKIGILGAIIPGKGQDVAITAFAKLCNELDNVELNIYGGVLDADYFRKLSQIAEDLHIAHKVHFKDFENDKENIYAQLGLLLNCSCMEGFGRTIVEAMAYGIPVIANAAGGVPEIIDEGITGFLYNNTATNLCSKMLTLLSDKALYESISANGIKKAIKEYSVERYAKAVEHVLIAQ